MGLIAIENFNRLTVLVIMWQFWQYVKQKCVFCWRDTLKLAWANQLALAHLALSFLSWINTIHSYKRGTKEIKPHQNHFGLSVHCSDSHHICFDQNKPLFTSLDVKIPASDAQPFFCFCPASGLSCPCSPCLCSAWHHIPGQSHCKSLWYCNPCCQSGLCWSPWLCWVPVWLCLHSINTPISSSATSSRSS